MSPTGQPVGAALCRNNRQSSQCIPLWLLSGRWNNVKNLKVVFSMFCGVFYTRYFVFKLNPFIVIVSFWIRIHINAFANGEHSPFASYHVLFKGFRFFVDTNLDGCFPLPFDQIRSIHLNSSLVVFIRARSFLQPCQQNFCIVQGKNRKIWHSFGCIMWQTLELVVVLYSWAIYPLLTTTVNISSLLYTFESPTNHIFP